MLEQRIFSRRNKDELLLDCVAPATISDTRLYEPAILWITVKYDHPDVNAFNVGDNFDSLYAIVSAGDASVTYGSFGVFKTRQCSEIAA